MAERKHEGRVAGAGMLWPASCCFGALIAALVVAIHRTGAMVLAAGWLRGSRLRVCALRAFWCSGEASCCSMLAKDSIVLRAVAGGAR